jgi:hypothetical protein
MEMAYNHRFDMSRMVSVERGAEKTTWLIRAQKDEMKDGSD